MIEKEEIGTKPFYRPGDVITNGYGGKGVIIAAKVTVNGQRYDWNCLREELPKGYWLRPDYEVDWITKHRNKINKWDQTQWKNAWWEAHEWQDVQLGLLHDKQVEGEPK